MRMVNGRTILSASDLMRFQGCQHATTLDMRHLRGELLAPAEDTPEAEILQRLGNEHERRFLAKLASESGDVAVMERTGAADDGIEQTLARLKEGRLYIYQAALRNEAWAGYIDFLERVARPSKLGNYSYEVIDTKLKRSADPKHVLQLVLYSDLLAPYQEVEPDQIHLILGDGSRISLRLLDYAAYARNTRQRLEGFVALPKPTRPEPVAACGLCRWRDHCSDEWNQTDNLCLVAGITKGQRSKLEAVGITTLQALSEKSGKVPRLADQTLDRLREQAKLQHLRRSGSKPQIKLKPIEHGRGLARLPEPAAGDLFFDMEGYPFIPGGREYLFGILVDTGATANFRPVWAHDAEAERAATAEVLDLFIQHLERFPGAHIYHYNHYEVTALKRLASLYGVRENALDHLLRTQKFVDLYRVVQQGIYASESGYSLKDLEVFYMGTRTEEVTSAADSVIAYEEWLLTRQDALLESIRRYNETDCRSTMGLRNWLIQGARPTGLAWYVPPILEDDGRLEASDTSESDRAEWQAIIQSGRARLGAQLSELVLELPWFHQREDKPAWWAMFDRAERESDELIDDLESLGDLVATGRAVPQKKSLVRSYEFPEQETKLREGAKVRLRGGLKSVSLEQLDLEARIAVVKFGPKAGEPPDRIDLIPGGPINNAVLRGSVRRVLTNIAMDRGRYTAIEDLLKRQLPKLRGLASGTSLINEKADVVSETTTAIGRLDSSCLPIQGPPGTGKTYVSSQSILALIRQGKRVAVTSNSHKAIDNLLLAVAARARETKFALEAIKKGGFDDALHRCGIEATDDNNDSRLTSYPLVGGTAWLFAREEHDQAFDYLFVDEAGQVSLANAIAAGAAARNLVLVGDPMQLSQPTQGVHPGESGLACLEFLLAGHTTVSAERGIFLPTSRRMHPQICRYVSDLVYDSRLSSEQKTANQRMVIDTELPRLPETGIVFWGIQHQGNSQSSMEEARLIASLVDRLCSGSFTDRDQNTRRMDISDILVVSPYNAQVNLLKRTVRARARVGTVDKFQGQEAPVCIVSMATSTAAEMPRNIEFLFSRNRLNVAVSRAQALVIVVASERLLEVPCRTIEEMKLVNALCALRDYASIVIRP